MRAGDQQSSGTGEAPLSGLAVSRPGKRGRHGVDGVKFPLPAVIEKAEGRVASLLDLGYHEPRTDGMDRARWYENGVVLPDRVPLNQVRNRPVLNGRSQLRS